MRKWNAVSEIGHAYLKYKALSTAFSKKTQPCISPGYLRYRSWLIKVISLVDQPIESFEAIWKYNNIAVTS